MGASRTRDKKFLLLDIRSTDTTEVRYLASDHPKDPFQVFLPREKKHRYDIDHREGLVLHPDRQGCEELSDSDRSSQRSEPEELEGFVAHRDDVLVEGIDLFKDFGVSLEKAEALNRIRFIDFTTGKWHEMVFPEPVYSAFPSGNPEYDTHTFRYSYQSLITPSERVRLRHGDAANAHC